MLMCFIELFCLFTLRGVWAALERVGINLSATVFDVPGGMWIYFCNYSVADVYMFVLLNLCICIYK